MSQAIELAVQATYGSVATSGLSNAHAGVRAVAEAFGYIPEELPRSPLGQTWACRAAIPRPRPTSGYREASCFALAGATDRLGCTKKPQPRVRFSVIGHRKLAASQAQSPPIRRQRLPQ